jgi:hypothetical protein
MMRWVASARMRARNIAPRTILLAGWLIVIAYAFPGYMNWDSGDQLFQSRQHRLEDWHPPIMGAYWHVIEHVVSGPFGMLVLQTVAFEYGVHALLCLRFRPRTAALLTAGFVVFPPILTPMAVVWKDAQMAGFLAAGLALALRPGRWKIVLGCALLTLASAVRDNAPAALPPLCLLIAAGWWLRRRLVTWGVAVALCVAIVATGLVLDMTTTRAHMHAWYKSVALHDIAGTLCFEEPMSDDAVRAALPGVPLLVRSRLQASMCEQYNPRAWFALFGDNPIFDQHPDPAERRARRAGWWRMVTEHTHAYLTHRWTVMKEVIGLSDSQPWEPVCQTFAANPDHLQRIHHDHSLSPFQRIAGQWFFQRWSTTLLYRPWAYVLVSFALLGYAAWRRDRLLAALLGSGLLYELSYFVGAAAPDFRYSHWLVVCCSLGVVIVFGERLRAGLRPDAGATARGEREHGGGERADDHGGEPR